MQNKVELLDKGFIYVEKVGDQTAESMANLFSQIKNLASQLRAANKPVLILSNAYREGKTDIKGREMAAEIGKTLDYDKSATYGASLFLKNERKLMIKATQLSSKVANFATRQEAEEWLIQS